MEEVGLVVNEVESGVEDEEIFELVGFGVGGGEDKVAFHYPLSFANLEGVEIVSRVFFATSVAVAKIIFINYFLREGTDDERVFTSTF